MNVTGTYGPELGEAIRKIQMTAKKHGGGNVVDGIIHPLPSRSGLAGDWDRNFRNGVSSTLSFLCYRLFRFSRDAYMKVGDTLNLAWSPDPFEM